MEMIVLVDEQDHELGSAEKLISHHANTPLHRAFSCYIFDEGGKFLVTKRADSKKVWPTVWTNSLCGHPGPGESRPDAVKRRAGYELGMEVKSIELMVPDYQYKTPPYRGIIEHEYCPIYIARAASEPVPNPQEVGAFAWVDWPTYAEALTRGRDHYSWWSKDQYRVLSGTGEFTRFLKTLN